MESLVSSNGVSANFAAIVDEIIANCMLTLSIFKGRSRKSCSPSVSQPWDV